MKNESFYEYIDGELDLVIKSEVYSPYFEKLKQDEQKKSVAFLIWFLNTYADISDVEDYITDGHDDFSCDIILDKTDSQGNNTFYIVQSKWNKIGNCGSEFDGKELKSFLNDVQCILKGDKEKGANARFNNQYDRLREHLKSNGRVKVIYLCLKNNCSGYDGNINSFKNTLSGDVDVEGFDINRLKIDYISREFKGSFSPNPLENIYDSSLDRIKISVCRGAENNSIEVQSPFSAYVFLIKPKLIFELVNKYGVSLFTKNVRNPILNSQINEEIKSTIIKNPAYFWYYNNGITGITRRLPRISNEAEEFDITGLQIINGAQTAYSIYLAYKDCNEQQRAILDDEARVTFRLLKSGGDDFDLKVTKYTNSQNPVSERDFWSNDLIQQEIQDYFYNTTYWYEKRDGEFRTVPDGIVKITNRFMAAAHLAFNLAGAVDVVNSAMKARVDEVDLLFTSRLENKDGLYERIFNKDTLPEDVHAAFVMLDQVTELPSYKSSFSQLMYTNCFHILSVSRIILGKYLRIKYGSEVKITPFILKAANGIEIGGEIIILRKIIAYAVGVLTKDIDNKSEDEISEYIFNLMSKTSYFEMLIDTVKANEVSIEEIESNDLSIYNEDEDEDEESGD
ncbi:AIPR family protein [Buttiauxella gaviniae]|uniref:AIPR family protein n=1 Tax=Buttiauxella gaviniae TaxID=82990 RepID=UPI0039750F2F